MAKSICYDRLVQREQTRWLISVENISSKFSGNWHSRNFRGISKFNSNATRTSNLDSNDRKTRCADIRTSCRSWCLLVYDMWIWRVIMYTQTDRTTYLLISSSVHYVHLGGDNYLRFLSRRENYTNCFLVITSEVQRNTIFLCSGNKNMQSMWRITQCHLHKQIYWQTYCRFYISVV